MSFPTVDGQSELLDVYTPDTPAPAGGRPVIIAIHGGGWRRFNKNGYGLRVADAFVQDGYAVVAPNYVLSAPGNPTWPVNFEDVQAAVRWVRSNAGTLGINPNEIVAMGESAGANLAALLGTYSTQSSSGDGVSSAVDAVVASSTPTDLTTLYAESPLAGSRPPSSWGARPSRFPPTTSRHRRSIMFRLATRRCFLYMAGKIRDPREPVEEMAAALTGGRGAQRVSAGQWRSCLDFPAHYSNLVPDVLEFLDATWKD